MNTERVVFTCVVRGQLYEIPLIQRYTKIGSGFFSRERCVKVDNVGLFVQYGKEEDLKPEVIRRHLIFARHAWCVVEGKNPTEAIKKFFSEWEGAKIGGKSVKSKALRINLEKPILEFPYCEYLQKAVTNEEDEHFICGYFLEDAIECGEYAPCTAEDPWDIGEPCPIIEYRRKYCEFKLKEVSPKKFLGFQVVTSADLGLS